MHTKCVDRDKYLDLLAVSAQTLAITQHVQLYIRFWGTHTFRSQADTF